jgi:hypothetical protein
VSGGLRKLPEIQLDSLPRMADFARWGEAVGQAQGWGEGAFSRAFEANQNSANITALVACPVAAAVLQLMVRMPAWDGTATELGARLREFVDEQTIRGRDWPKGANKLSGKLRRAAPALRREGVEVEFGTSGSKRVITIWRTSTDDAGSLPSGSSASPPCERNEPSGHDLWQIGLGGEASSASVPRRRQATPEPSSARVADDIPSSVKEPSVPGPNHQSMRDLGNESQDSDSGCDDADGPSQQLSDGDNSMDDCPEPDDDIPF